MALNLAFGNDGAVVLLDDDVVLDVPIHIVRHRSARRDTQCVVHGCCHRVGARSSATVVETRIGVGAEFGGSNIRTTITLGTAASLEHVLLQDVPPSHVHLSSVDVHQAADSRFLARSFNLGASYGRAAYDVDLAGPGAHRRPVRSVLRLRSTRFSISKINVVHTAEELHKPPVLSRRAG